MSEASGGGFSERSELTAGGLAVLAEGSGLRVFNSFIKLVFSACAIRIIFGAKIQTFETFI